MDWPALALNIVTYNRRDMLYETVRRLHEHVAYSGPMHYIIADDGSDDGTQEMVRGMFPHARIVQSQRVGLGANTNAGLRAALTVADVVYQSQDDLWLLATLDLDAHVQRLLTDPTCGFIRLWGVAGHHYEAKLEGSYWRLMWHSDELYIPSDRPHVKHRRFHEHFGFYPEGLATGHTEEAWCHQAKGRAGLEGRQLDVFVPHSTETEKNFEHMAWGSRWRDQGL